MSDTSPLPVVGRCSRCSRPIFHSERIGDYCKFPHATDGRYCEGVFVKLDDLPAVTFPDESTTIRARCPVCKAVAYKSEDIGTRCVKKDQHGRRCYGVYEGDMNDDEFDVINVNGDKVIEFARSVRKLADLFESMNILGIRDLFLMGRKAQCVEDVIKQKNDWNDALTTIRNELKGKTNDIEVSRQTLDGTIDALERLDKVLYGLGHIKRMEHLRQIILLCDQLDAHRKSGTFDIDGSLLKLPPL